MLIGACAGITATTAMTLVADALFRRLPARERYPLPPRELVERAAAATNLDDDVDEDELRTYTLAGHFAFGAAAGSLYAAMQDRGRAPVVALSGVAYGVAVWTVSYLGWVPAIGLLPPATRHPPRRNVLMIAGHAVWGAVLGLVTVMLSRALTPIARGHSERGGDAPFV